MNNNPLISICIPIFNGAPLMHKAIESSINQTYENIEIIIADDASTDNTKEMALNYAAKDNRIKYFRNATNLGPIKNFFNAFKMASGKFIQLLNHDDWLSKNYVEEGVKKFNAYPKTVAVISRSIILKEIKIDKKSHFELNSEITFKPGIYPTDYYIKSSYKDVFAALFMLSLMRKNDLIEAMSFLIEAMTNNYPDYTSKETKKFLNLGWGIDIIVPLKILTKYDFMVFTNNSAYIKIEQPGSLGKSVKFDYAKAIDTLKYRAYVKICLEYVFRMDWIKYLLGMRIFVGSETINTVIFNFAKSGFKLTYWKNFPAALNLFFQSYSFWEKIFIFLSFPPLLTIRILKLVKRKIFRKKLFICDPNYFIDKDCLFKI